MTNLAYDSSNLPATGVYVPGTGVVSVQGGTASIDSLGNTSAPLIAEVAQAGIIGPAASQPSATNVGTDTPWYFAKQVRHIFIQNNTAVNVQFSLDAAATAGSPILAPGAAFSGDIAVTVIHLLTAAAQNINGSSAVNIVIWGWT